MRSLWKGSISFGLVNIPVRLYAATERRDLKFNYLHEACGTPIKYKKWCPACDREIGREEIVWGYEIEKGRYVILRQDDFENVPLPTARTVEILDFVRLDEIDPIYYDRTYFLEPMEGAGKAYALLRRAMSHTNRVALAKVALRTKESLAAVRVYQGRYLIMETMFYPEEIRPAEELQGVPGDEGLRPNEVELATTLIDSLADRFEPGKYTNEYRRALLELIQAKAEGEDVREVRPPEAAEVVDLMEALRASIAAAEAARAGDRPGAH